METILRMLAILIFVNMKNEILVMTSRFKTHQFQEIEDMVVVWNCIYGEKMEIPIHMALRKKILDGKLKIILSKY